MITVIFNKDTDNVLSYQFDTYSENYSALGGWILRFGVSETTLDQIEGNLADYIRPLFNTNYIINTIHVYDENSKLIDSFDDYSIISECITFYDETVQAQRGELRFEK